MKDVSIQNGLWVFAVLVLLLLVCISLFVRSSAIALEKHAGALRDKLGDQQQREARLVQLSSQVHAIRLNQHAEIGELARLSKSVKTRDQFLVTQGDKIVRQLVVYAPSGERRMCFYVPAGNHRLVYAIREAVGESSATYATLARWGDDHRQLQEPTSIELRGETVYELRIRVRPTTKDAIEIQLIGTDNDVVHENEFALSFQAMEGLGNLQNDSAVFATYPNELRSKGDAKRHVDDMKSAPVTPLLTLSLNQMGGRGRDTQARMKMRVWIDSDSPPCLSDITVANDYKFVSGMKSWTPFSQDKFQDTFQDYDGTGRYYFRGGYFPDASTATAD
ncbi:MAG: hypothetical protein WBD20_13725 [Pirellulaceae bacterium]